MARATHGARPATAGWATRNVRISTAGLSLMAPLSTIALLLAVWEFTVQTGRYRSFILPAPLDVFHRLLDATVDGTLPSNAGTTLGEAGAGFALAALIAFPLGYALAHTPLLERFFAPLIAASQAVPAVAVAPLLLLWFGNGLTPKVVVCAVIVVFPLLVSTMTGIRGIAREYLEVARVFGVPLWERILRVEIPLAAPVILSGVKVALALALTGAVVGEFVASDSGLGYLLTFTRFNLDTPLLYATLGLLAAIGVALFLFVSLLERVVSRWQG